MVEVDSFVTEVARTEVGSLVVVQVEVVESSAGHFAGYTRVENWFLATRKQQLRQWPHLLQRLPPCHHMLTAGLNFARVEVCNQLVHFALVVVEIDLAAGLWADHFPGLAVLPVVLLSYDVLGSLGASDI